MARTANRDPASASQSRECGSDAELGQDRRSDAGGEPLEIVLRLPELAVGFLQQGSNGDHSGRRLVGASTLKDLSQIGELRPTPWRSRSSSRRL